LSFNGEQDRRLIVIRVV